MVSKADKAIIDEAKERFRIAQDADNDNRLQALDDIKFVHDEDGQWTDEARTARKGRPCMTFDHTSAALDQVIGDYLQSRPGIKVRGTDDKTDPKLADIYTGLIRNIESGSVARDAYSTAFKLAATGGYGVWRVHADYEDEDSFDQCVYIKKVANPFTVLFDPQAQETTKHDGRFAFVEDVMEMVDFKAQYPDAIAGEIDNSGVGTRDSGWFLDDAVRVVEYFRKKPIKKTICKLSTGEVVDKKDIEPVMDEIMAAGVQVIAEREVDSHKIEWFKLTAAEILERGEFPSKYIPLVPCYGKTINIEGKEKYRGLVRKAKDAQRSYNYHRSQTIEVVALQPKAPFMATPAMISGFENQWKTINTSNAPIILYKPDPDLPGMRPTREAPPAFPQALMQEALTALEDIKAATGIHNAALGQQSNETSGRAIRERKLEGDTANFEFVDNFSLSLEHTGRILIDMIPKIYDTERIIRILGEDGAESYETINKAVLDQQTQQVIKLNDLSQGKYDVVVTTGPSYSTRRVETAEQLTAVMQANPQLGMMLSDLWIKSLDLVGADDAVKRVRKLLITQGLVEPTEEEAAEMPQQQPNPMEQIAQMLALEKAGAEVDKIKADADVKSADAALKTLEYSMATGNVQLQQMALMQLVQSMQQQPAMPPQAQNLPAGFTG